MIYLNATGAALSTSASPTRWYSSSLPGAVVTGTAGADWLSAPDPGGDPDGRRGRRHLRHLGQPHHDHRRWPVAASTRCSRWAGLTMPGEYREPAAMWRASAGLGNALNNIITGSAARRPLDGGAGNDVLIGGAGADASSSAAATAATSSPISQPGADTILLQDYAFQLRRAQAAMRQAGADTVLSLGGGESLVLRNTQAASAAAPGLPIAGRPVASRHAADLRRRVQQLQRLGQWHRHHLEDHLQDRRPAPHAVDQQGGRILFRQPRSG